MILEFYSYAQFSLICSSPNWMSLRKLQKIVNDFLQFSFIRNKNSWRMNEKGEIWLLLICKLCLRVFYCCWVLATFYLELSWETQLTTLITHGPNPYDARLRSRLLNLSRVLNFLVCDLGADLILQLPHLSINSRTHLPVNYFLNTGSEVKRYLVQIIIKLLLPVRFLHFFW